MVIDPTTRRHNCNIKPMPTVAVTLTTKVTITTEAKPKINEKEIVSAALYRDYQGNDHYDITGWTNKNFVGANDFTKERNIKLYGGRGKCFANKNC